MKECSPVERFLDFISMERHGAAYLSDTIVFFLTEKGISLDNCQEYNGLQAKLKEHCTCTLIVPCLADSLTHVIGETAWCIMEATDYFQFLANKNCRKRETKLGAF
ncbi:hypothetical protein RI129_012367 [Pyrocoelia pectoralis]|uniref:Uncharacterized protein n=1 Tax=Pyrocoelia pectoralis TaxID=417401 RepID=A0AAN7ZC11_9COLE